MYDDFGDFDQEYYEGEDYNVFEEAQVYEDERLDRLADEEDALAEFEQEHGELPVIRSRADAEYHRGVAEARAYQTDVAIYGRELAEQWEMEREMRDGW